MFEENIVKMKKDQFTEAEAIACLINDEQKRKMAFLSTCALFAFKNYIEKENYKSSPVTKINLFRVPKVYEKYGISDLYIDNIRFDIRVSLDGKLFSIPKIHIENSITADFYVVFKATKNPLKCEALGYIKKDDLVFETQDSNYYYVSNALLNNIKDLKEELNTYIKPLKQFFETEHTSSVETFAAFLDEELEEDKSQKLIEHLLECEECRGLFVEYNFIEEVLSKSNNYPEIKAQLEEELNPSKTSEPSIEETPLVVLPSKESDLITDDNTEVIEETPFITEEPSLEIQEVSEEQTLEFSDTSLSEEPQGLVLDEAPIEESEYLITEEQPLEIQEVSEEQTLEFSDTSSSEEPQELVLDEAPIEESEYLITEGQPLEIQEINEEQALEFSDTSLSEEPQGLIIDETPIEENNEYLITEEQPLEIQEINGEQALEFSDTSLSEEPQGLVLNEEPIHKEQSVELSNTTINDNLEELIIDKNDSFDNTVNNEYDNFVLNEIEDNKNSGLDLQIPEEETNNYQEETVQEINYSSNWNELFTNNTVKETPVNNTENGEQQNQYIAEDLSIDNVQDNNITPNENIENIYNESVYDENSINLNVESDPVTPTIKHSTKKSKTPIGGLIAATTAILIIAVGITGVITSNGKSSKPANNTANNFPLDINTGSNDINQAMTNAFSDNQTLLKVTNVSWLKDKNLEVTPDLKEYLSALGLAVWDDLDNDIKRVQGYTTTNPTKINIKINPKGEIESTTVSESCGVDEIDEIILQSVKDSTAQLPPSAYSLTGKNINLKLVVNF